MEFVRVALDETTAVYEATEAVQPSGKALDEALSTFKGVVGAGFDGSRLWVRVDAGAQEEAPDGS